MGPRTGEGGQVQTMRTTVKGEATQTGEGQKAEGKAIPNPNKQGKSNHKEICDK